MTLSGAERQRRYRERNAERLKQERAAQRAREELRAVLELGSPVCACCGEERADFLTVVSDCAYCRNCASVIEQGRICPHRAIGRRLR